MYPPKCSHTLISCSDYIWFWSIVRFTECNKATPSEYLIAEVRNMNISKQIILIQLLKWHFMWYHHKNWTKIETKKQKTQVQRIFYSFIHLFVHSLWLRYRLYSLRMPRFYADLLNDANLRQFTFPNIYFPISIWTSSVYLLLFISSC